MQRIPCNFHTFWVCKKYLCMKFHPLHLVCIQWSFKVLQWILFPLLRSSSWPVRVWTCLWMPNLSICQTFCLLASSMYHLPKIGHMWGFPSQSISQTALNNEQGFHRNHYSVCWVKKTSGYIFSCPKCVSLLENQGSFQNTRFFPFITNSFWVATCYWAFIEPNNFQWYMPMEPCNFAYLQSI